MVSAATVSATPSSEGAAHRQRVGDPRLPFQPLAIDLSEQLCGFGIDGGRAAEDLLNWRGSVEKFAADLREAGEESTRIGLSEGGLHGWPLVHGDGLVIAHEGRVEHRGEDAPLAPEQPVDGGQRGGGGFPDRLDGGRSVSPLHEQISGCGYHVGAGAADLRLAAGVVVAAALDRLTHIRDSNTIIKIVRLS